MTLAKEVGGWGGTAYGLSLSWNRQITQLLSLSLSLSLTHTHTHTHKIGYSCRNIWNAKNLSITFHYCMHMETLQALTTVLWNR
jgi:hypothetical protein